MATPGSMEDVYNIDTEGLELEIDAGTYTPGQPLDTGGLSQTGASAIGSGIQAAGTLAQGVAETRQMGKLSEQAYKQGLADIDIAGARQSQSQEVQERAQTFLDTQQQFANYQEDAALRQTHMLRDFEDEMSKAMEQRNAAKKIRGAVGANESFKDALIQMNRGR